MVDGNSSKHNYNRRIENWFVEIQHEAHTPTVEQQRVLRAVQNRVLLEFRLEKEGCELPRSHPSVQAEEEPMRAFIHGPPGTGKSKVMQWVIPMFPEALKWEHGVDFV